MFLSLGIIIFPVVFNNTYRTITSMKSFHSRKVDKCKYLLNSPTLTLWAHSQWVIIMLCRETKEKFGLCIRLFQLSDKQFCQCLHCHTSLCDLWKQYVVICSFCTVVRGTCSIDGRNIKMHAVQNHNTNTNPLEM